MFYTWICLYMISHLKCYKKNPQKTISCILAFQAMDSKPEALALRKEDFYSDHDIEVLQNKVVSDC